MGTVNNLQSLKLHVHVIAMINNQRLNFPYKEEIRIGK